MYTQVLRNLDYLDKVRTFIFLLTFATTRHDITHDPLVTRHARAR